MLPETASALSLPRLELVPLCPYAVPHNRSFVRERTIIFLLRVASTAQRTGADGSLLSTLS